jgi:hypothetical protein
VEIAEELRLSVNTVRSHVQRMLAKLNVHSTLEAAALGRRAGITPRPRGNSSPPANDVGGLHPRAGCAGPAIRPHWQNVGTNGASTKPAQ